MCTKLQGHPISYEHYLMGKWSNLQPKKIKNKNYVSENTWVKLQNPPPIYLTYD